MTVERGEKREKIKSERVWEYQPSPASSPSPQQSCPVPVSFAPLKGTHSLVMGQETLEGIELQGAIGEPYPLQG